MNPKEIEHHFGADALNKLYDVILDRPVHELADWILSFHTEAQIATWLTILKQDEMDGEAE